MIKSPAIFNIIKQINPYRRMINSEGMDRAFEYVLSILPNLQIHEFSPGTKADDWEVPYGWELKSAYIKNSQGGLIVSDKDSHLFVAAYSDSIHGYFKKSEIEKHLRYHKELEHAFFMEHRNAYDYNLNDWGITLPKIIWDNLSDEETYEVFIDITKDYDRSMKIGEMCIQGKSDLTISFTAHIDELCNDNLSSCATLIQLFNDLSIDKTFNPYYTYQLLLVPETIGTYFYIHKNQQKLGKIISMVNLETVGRGEKWIIKKSLNPVKYIDKVMKLSAEETLDEYNISDFFDGYGNEERIFEYPTINIPSVALQRYPFKEYHSSDDVPEKIDLQNLEKAYQFALRVINMIEADFIPESKYILPPWLTKHNLYFDSVEDPKNFNLFLNQIQFNLFKGNSLVELAYLFEIPFQKLYNYIIKFYQKQLINKKSTDEIWKNK